MLEVLSAARFLAKPTPYGCRRMSVWRGHVNWRSRACGVDRKRSAFGMRRSVLARRGGITLGVIYVLSGIAETVRLTVTGDGGFFFWFGTLVGGGILLLLGTLRGPSTRDRSRDVAVLVGAALGIPATAWTILVPLLATSVMAAAALSLARPVDAAA